MAIIRAHKNKYASISNKLSQHPNLSFEARGVLVYLLSHRDDWRVEPQDVEKAGRIGEQKRQRIFKELERAGFLKRIKRHVEGRFEWDYLLYDEPEFQQSGLYPEKPVVVSAGLYPEKQPLEKPVIILNTELVNTEKRDTEAVSTKAVEATASPPLTETQKKRERGTRLPDLFPLTDEMREYARKERPDVNVETEYKKFCNYWYSIPGMKGVKLSWKRTWENWILDARVSPVRHNSGGFTH